MNLEPSALSGRFAAAEDMHPSDAYRRPWELLEENAPVKALELLAPAIDAEHEASMLRVERRLLAF